MERRGAKLITPDDSALHDSVLHDSVLHDSLCTARVDDCQAATLLQANQGHTSERCPRARHGAELLHHPHPTGINNYLSQKTLDRVAPRRVVTGVCARSARAALVQDLHLQQRGAVCAKNSGAGRPGRWTWRRRLHRKLEFCKFISKCCIETLHSALV